MLAAPKFTSNKVDITDSIFSLVEEKQSSLLVGLLVHNHASLCPQMRDFWLWQAWGMELHQLSWELEDQ